MPRIMKCTACGESDDITMEDGNCAVCMVCENEWEPGPAYFASIALSDFMAYSVEHVHDGHTDVILMWNDDSRDPTFGPSMDRSRQNGSGISATACVTLYCAKCTTTKDNDKMRIIWTKSDGYFTTHAEELLNGYVKPALRDISRPIPDLIMVNDGEDADVAKVYGFWFDDKRPEFICDIVIDCTGDLRELLIGNFSLDFRIETYTRTDDLLHGVTCAYQLGVTVWVRNFEILKDTCVVTVQGPRERVETWSKKRYTR